MPMQIPPSGNEPVAALSCSRIRIGQWTLDILNDTIIVYLSYAGGHSDTWPLGFLMRNVRVPLHCTENPIYVFPEMKLGGLVSNSYIHVSVSDLYTVYPGSVCLSGCNKIGRPILGIYQSLRGT
jgi:hypothetical protein